MRVNASSTRICPMENGVPRMALLTGEPGGRRLFVAVNHGGHDEHEDDQRR